MKLLLDVFRQPPTSCSSACDARDAETRPSSNQPRGCGPNARADGSHGGRVTKSWTLRVGCLSLCLPTVTEDTASVWFEAVSGKLPAARPKSLPFPHNFVGTDNAKRPSSCHPCSQLQRAATAASPSDARLQGMPGLCVALDPVVVAYRTVMQISLCKSWLLLHGCMSSGWPRLRPCSIAPVINEVLFSF